MDDDASSAEIARRLTRTLTLNWRRLAWDVVVVTSWATLLAMALDHATSALPGAVPSGELLYYALLLAGIVTYTLFTDPWRFPE